MGLSRGKGLNQVSTKRAAENRKRKTATEAVRARAKGRCEAFSRIASMDSTLGGCRGQFDYHEVLTRARGGSISDPDNILQVCRKHHDWITEHPLEAHELGLVAHSWEEAHRTAVIEGILRELDEKPARTPSTGLRAANVVPRPVPRSRTVRVLPAAESATPAETISVTHVHPQRPWTLNGERKMTPYGRAAKVKLWREAWAIIGHQTQRFRWVDVEVKVHLRDMREQDTVGAVSAYKAAMDGLVDAKVLPGDNPLYVRSVTFRAPEQGTYDALELVLTGEPA